MTAVVRPSLLRPVHVPVQKLKRSLAVDRVRAVEEFDFGAVAEASFT